VWSRPNQFGHGVPFRFPSTVDTGPGLTDAGKELVQVCNELRILIDLSHLNEKGFWDVAKISTAPLVATHSNAHAISASSRNLTDKQLRAIGESGGMIGLNYATGFLREDGRWNTSTPPEIMIRHLKHMIEVAGEDCVGLGSDFDGARIPAFIGDVGGQQKLVHAMAEAGFGDTLINKITHENWLRVLEKTWGG
jgi:membrane dipeptidase